MLNGPHHGGGHHPHGGRRGGGWRGYRAAPIVFIDDTDYEDDDMHRDPHDALLLTERPTTVVTQATKMLDDMPDPYGAQSDEESMFAGVSADDAEIDSRAEIGQARAQSLASRTAGVTPAAPLAPAATAAAPSNSGLKNIVMVLAGIVAINYLIKKF